MFDGIQGGKVGQLVAKSPIAVTVDSQATPLSQFDGGEEGLSRSRTKQRCKQALPMLFWVAQEPLFLLE